MAPKINLGVQSEAKAPIVKKNAFADFNSNNLNLNNLNLNGIIPQQQNLTKAQQIVINYAANPFLISNNKMALSYIYKNSGVIQSMIDQPVDDCFRGGITITINDERFGAKEVEKIQYDLENESVIRTYANGERWARLFGGAGIIIDVEGDNPATPFSVDKLKKGQRVAFYAADLWELNTVSSGQVGGEDKPYIDDMASEKETPYVFYGKRLHKTRVIKVIGKEATSQIRSILKGWGMSMIECMIDPLSNYYELNNMTSNYIDQAKIDIFKYSGFNDAMELENGAETILAKATLANMLKGINNGLVLDSEDDYTQKQISMSGVPELREQNRIEMGAATRINQVKIYGTSSPSFNSGEDVQENYNGMIESTLREPSKFKLIKIVQIMFQLRYGAYPDEIKIGFKPLRTLNSKEEQDLKSTKLDGAIRMYDRGLLSKEDFLKTVNYDNILPFKVDPSAAIGELPTPPPAKPVLDLYGDDSKERNKLNSQTPAQEK